MTRVTTLTSRQPSKNGPTVWGDEWMSQKAKIHLAFSWNLKGHFQIFSNLFWSPPNLAFFCSWKWCGVLSIIEMSHYLLFRVLLYISYIYVVTFRIDKSPLGRAEEINHTHWWHGKSGVLGTGWSVLSLESPSSSPNNWCSKHSWYPFSAASQENSLPQMTAHALLFSLMSIYHTMSLTETLS